MLRKSDSVTRSKRLCGVLLGAVLVLPLSADEVEKVLFLVVEKDEVIASNTKAGRFDRLKMQAKERIRDYEVANAVAVVVTNQRYAAYGVLSGGWQTIKLIAQEKTESIQVQDYSATIVSSERILNFYGRSGAWAEVRRSVQFR
ncbi:MAG: hypothetical protein ABF290_16290 [Thiogranum sp.]